MPKRRARFVCVAAAVLIPSTPGDRKDGGLKEAGEGVPSPATDAVTGGFSPSPEEYVATGEWWGTITTEAHGDGGFGYDPVFLPEGSGLTVAQLSQEVKDQASHRALAGKALLELLPH